ncbi:alpha/beta fold hydrolase [Streptomyces sp. NPDC050439]|uniref:thioesterase II family protein n=1 Tax=unclassified Streptomyces TaxID=2593676 RepID=UPI003436E08B
MHPARPPVRTPPEARAAGPWFPAGGSGTSAPGALPLVCFPYAGATPSVFHRWTAALGTGVRVEPLLLPGRGLRLAEEPFTSMAPLVEAITEALLERGLDADCGFFGHSMGSVLAYEVACALRTRGRPGPRGLFLSGSRAPHSYGNRSDSTLPDEELIALLGDLGGVGGGRDAVRQTYLRRRLPALRADLRVCDHYRWQRRPPLDIPLTVLAGSHDPLATAGQAESWRAYTTAAFHRRQVPGGHFYLLDEPELLLRELRDWCAALASAESATPGLHGPAHTPQRYS